MSIFTNNARAPASGPQVGALFGKPSSAPANPLQGVPAATNEKSDKEKGGAPVGNVAEPKAAPVEAAVKPLIGAPPKALPQSSVEGSRGIVGPTSKLASLSTAQVVVNDLADPRSLEQTVEQVINSFNTLHRIAGFDHSSENPYSNIAYLPHYHKLAMIERRDKGKKTTNELQFYFVFIDILTLDVQTIRMNFLNKDDTTVCVRDNCPEEWLEFTFMFSPDSNYVYVQGLKSIFGNVGSDD